METSLPLLTWQKHAEHHRLQEKRERLLKRISKLRPHAQKRLELEIEARRLTLRQIEIENQLTKDRR